MKYFLLIFIVFSSCSDTNNENINFINIQKADNETIKSFSISTFGGEMGFYQSLTITTDSLFYDFNLAVDSTKRKNKNRINSLYKLEDIIDINDLISFSKIKNGESRQPVDGTDTKIEIKTNLNTYSVVNGENDKNWQTLELKINKILIKEFDTI